MTEQDSSQKKNCGNKKGAMLAYGVIQLGTSIISALSLAAIAIGFCAVKQESKVFTTCVEEVRENGKSSSQAVHFCNGGR
ncbi:MULTISPECIES: hypothetical protein [Prochlorococcus]|uniref:hypothetical protein n=1 Tax=Prochlorococcus TaxID=1218 RepID=UPI0005337654|nr:MULTISPECIES: hypothetical protein [Prochlorococcus]KGG14158.1 hypothetical protein EV05_0047 [Prochlorococcus sp. MIT 0601]